MGWLALGLGSGIAGIITTVVLAFVVHRKLIDRADRDADDRRFALKVAGEATAKSGDLAEDIRVHLNNVAALIRENTDLKTANRAEAAKATLMEKQRDDLLAIVSKAPGALPLAVRAELDRLRQQHTATATEIAGAATGDPSGGETDPMHVDGSDIHRPR